MKNGEIALAILGVLAIAAMVYVSKKTLPEVNMRRERANAIVEDPETPQVRIVPNPGGGDCLFHCFVTAMEILGKRTSVKRLREVVASQVTADQFQSLRTIYEDAKKENETTVLMDYDFMKGCHTIEDLKKVMQTPLYFGDEIAVSILERFTGIKALIVTDQTGELAVAKRIDDEWKPPRDNYIILLLKDIHYQLVECNGTTVYSKDELPECFAEQ